MVWLRYGYNVTRTASLSLVIALAACMYEELRDLCLLFAAVSRSLIADIVASMRWLAGRLQFSSSCALIRLLQYVSSSSFANSLLC